MSLLVVVFAIACTAVVRSDDRVRTQGRVTGAQPANLTRNSLLIRGRTPFVLAAYEISGDGTHGAVGTVQPGLALYNANSGALSSDDQINVPPHGEYTIATSGSGHDAPSIVHTADGGVLAMYGAISTYAGYHPPPAWHCGFAIACEPFKFAHAAADDERLVDDLAGSQEYLLPSVGISEASYVTLGDATLIGGQQQPSTRFGQSGAQGYLALHAHGGGLVFETEGGLWDFHSGIPQSNGLTILTTTPSDDAYVDFGITSASGPGSARITIDGATCSANVDSGGSPERAAADIARAFASCSAFAGRFGAMQVAYDPAMRVHGVVLAPAVVGITARALDGLPTWSNVQLSCSGGIACGSPHGANTVADVRGSGLHRHFLFGGLIQIGSYAYYLMDVEQLTGSWLGKGQSSLGLALACFRTAGGSESGWTWTDCAGRNAFRVHAGEAPSNRLRDGRYTIPAPERGFSGGMAPYVTDWSMTGQGATPLAPVVAAVSVTRASDGTLMFVHGCQTTNRIYTVCYARFDPRTGRTVSAGTVAEPPGGSLTSVAVRTRREGTIEAGVLTGEADKWGCGGTGLCFMTYRYDGSRWIRLGTAAIGGDESAGFPGTVSVDGDRFVVQMHRKSGASYDVIVQTRS